MSYLRKLKESILIDKKTVSRVHKYVETKYPQNTKVDNKEIVKEALERIVLHELRNVDLTKKDLIIDNIIDKALSKDDGHVTKLDVIDICNKTIEIKDSSFKSIEKWIKENIDIEANEDIGEFLREIKGIDLVEQSVDIDKKREDGLAVVPEIILDRSKNLRNVFGGMLKKINPVQLFRITKIGFISMMIFACVFFYYNENVGMAEVNSKEAKVNYINNMAVAYDEYAQEVQEQEIKFDVLACHPHLPEYFDYVEVNEDKLKAYLSKRNSILTDDKYFNDIIKTAKEFNLNPLVLFAITGQEQGFVPRTDKHAEKIANNPFNVFVSWMHYNKTLKDSSEIAARTVINLAKGNQQGINTFKWINRLYADDYEWYEGVQILFWDMMKFCDIDGTQES